VTNTFDRHYLNTCPNDPKCLICTGAHLSMYCPDSNDRPKRESPPEPPEIDMTNVTLDSVKLAFKSFAPLRDWSYLYKAAKAYFLLDKSHDFISLNKLLDDLDLDITFKGLDFAIRPRDKILVLGKETQGVRMKDDDDNLQKFVAKLCIDSDFAPFALDQRFYPKDSPENDKRLAAAGLVVGRDWKPCSWCGQDDHMDQPKSEHCPVPLHERRKRFTRQTCATCGEFGHHSYICKSPPPITCPNCR
jgi:hypothetical protein